MKFAHRIPIDTILKMLSNCDRIQISYYNFLQILILFLYSTHILILKIHISIVSKHINFFLSANTVYSMFSDKSILKFEI